MSKSNFTAIRISHKSRYKPGAVFCRLKLIGHVFWIGRIPYVVCECECGNVKCVQVSDLCSGHATSCGCRRRDLAKAGAKHGLSVTPENIGLCQVFYGMMFRCYNPNGSSYSRYGGRGIVVCDEWKNNITAFVRWGHANGYQEDLQIDRIDNDGNYEPSNCRFVTRKQNSRNRSTNRSITAFGETKPLVAWAEDERCSCGHEALISRIKRGWDNERAITAPHRLLQRR